MTVSNIHRPRICRLGSRAEAVRMNRAPPIMINSGATKLYWNGRCRDPTLVHRLVTWPEGSTLQAGMVVEVVVGPGPPKAARPASRFTAHSFRTWPRPTPTPKPRPTPRPRHDPKPRPTPPRPPG